MVSNIKIYVKERSDPHVVSYRRDLDVKEWLVEPVGFAGDLVHREDGPAIIYHRNKAVWFLNGHEITDKVRAWRKKHKLKHWSEWTNTERVLFKLTFVGE